MTGPRFAHYEILGPLGQGGMGEVHRARDSKLGREVALKLLPEDFARDPERLARFRREAKVLASLNHPNIAAIYGLEEDQGRHFLIMELAEGADLAVRMAQGPVPVAETVAIARQLAAGLEEAHERGVVHRDLKPANIKLGEDGKVKILDFGLARAYAGESTGEGDPAQSPTITAAMTQQGVILGTAAYMSPEQARGRSVDRRADIWAFGVILFEMLTGRRLFEGETISDTLAGVLKTEPDLDELPPDTPPALRWLLERCLKKNPEQRLRDIGEARIVLDGDLEQVPTASLLGLPAAAEASRRRPLVWAAVAVIALVAGLLAGRQLRPAAPPPPSLHAYLLAPTDHRFDLEDGAHLALSPDGTRLAFVANDSVRQRSLWVRRLDSPEAYRLSGTEGAYYPFWSFDGDKIGFFVDGRMRKIDADGGVATTICEAGGGRGGTWLADGRILFARTNRDPIHVVSSTGGTPEAVTAMDSTQNSHRWPEILPDGRHFLYTALGNAPPATYWRDLEEGGEKLLMKGVLRAEYQGGRLFYVRDEALWVRPFDPARGDFEGEEALVAESIISSSNFGGAAYTVGDDGTLIYAQGVSVSYAALQVSDRKGEVLDEIDLGNALVDDPALSPDGRRVALALASPDAAGESDIWIQDLQRGTLSRFTLGEDADDPCWSPDGKRLAYASPPKVLVRSTVGQREILQQFELGGDPVLHDWSPDGSYLVMSVPSDERDIVKLDLETGEVEPLVQSDGVFNVHPALSPDGKWLTYMSLETGNIQIYLRRLTAGGGTWQVSRNGGFQPLFTPSGDEVLFRMGRRLISVSVDWSEEAPILGPERPVGEFPVRMGRFLTHQYRITPEGNLLYILDASPRGAEVPLHLVKGWERVVLGG